MTEVEITINGVRLSTAQAMVVRIACSNLHAEMQQPDALGEDMHGRRMVTAYRARLDEILPMLLNPEQKP